MFLFASTWNGDLYVFIDALTVVLSYNKMTHICAGLSKLMPLAGWRAQPLAGAQALLGADLRAHR